MARPVDRSDVATLLTWCNQEHVALVPRAAATGMPGGNVGPGVVLDLMGLDHIEAPDAETRTIRVGAGAVIGRVEGMARACGLRLPPLPSSAPWCTVGGLLANNGAGAHTFSSGAMRAWVESAELVLVDGRIEHWSTQGLPEGLPGASPDDLRPGDRWPAVRKNSSGYALDAYARSGRALDLVVGSEGTLAVITGATLRLDPVPEQRALVAVACPDAEALLGWCAWAREAGSATCEMLGRRLLGMIRLDDDPELSTLGRDLEAVLLLEIEGSAARVDADLGRLLTESRARGTRILVAREEGMIQALWELRHRASPTIAAAAERGLRSLQFIEDSVVPPVALARYIDGVSSLLREETTDAVLFGHAGDAHLHVNPLVDVRRPDWKERVRRLLEGTAALVAELGGTLAGEHGDGRVRAPFLERIWGVERVQRFQALKRAFDPNGILNPGVLLPAPGQDPLEGLSL
ncbi:MAG: FAD-binding oxidoreductase [Gemmatimonadota bacterium]